jgi:hypothetical protein
MRKRLIVWGLLVLAIVAVVLVWLCFEISGRDRRSERQSANEWSGGVEVREGELSMEEILRIAHKAAVEDGVRIRRFECIYDHGNERWERYVPLIPIIEETAAEFAGRDYQVVVYVPKYDGPAREVWVLVDRKTGEVLRVI